MAESTSQQTQRKQGIRCQHLEEGLAPYGERGSNFCDLLLMEKQGDTVGISDKHGHFTPIDVLFNEAQRRGLVVQPQDSKEESVTQTRKSHRYADQGQIDTLWAFASRGIYGPPGYSVGSSVRARDGQDLIRVASTDAGMVYHFQDDDALETSEVIVTVIDLSRGRVNADSQHAYISISRRGAKRFAGRNEWLPLYEDEAEALIAELRLVRDKDMSSADPREFLS